jgi:hypothetical protein
MLSGCSAGAHYPIYTHICLQICRYNFANDMTDMVGDAPQLFIFMLIRDLDKDMWDDARSGIAHLSLFNFNACPRVPA